MRKGIFYLEIVKREGACPVHKVFQRDWACYEVLESQDQNVELSVKVDDW